MLTIEENLNANSHDRAVGQRVTGHFDHTASRLVGPPSNRSGNHDDTPSESDSTSNVLLLDCTVDENTGEWIYEVRS